MPSAPPWPGASPRAATRSASAGATPPSRKALIDELKAEGHEVHAFSVDARQEAEVQDLFAKVEERIGPIEVCLFNAGSNVNKPLLETTEKLFFKAWELACYGGFLVGREAARYMLPRGRGTILFTGATASVRGGKGFAAFSSAKFGLRAVAQSMARELGPKNIHVAHLLIDAGVDSEAIHQRMRARNGDRGQRHPAGQPDQDRRRSPKPTGSPHQQPGTAGPTSSISARPSRNGEMACRNAVGVGHQPHDPSALGDARARPRYKTMPIGPRTGETKTAEYTALNPRQKVPLLQDGDFCIGESAAIVAYLSRMYSTPERSLIPEPPREYAAWLEWCFFIVAELDSTSLYVMRRHRADALGPIYGIAPEVVAKAGEYFRQQLRHVEVALADGRQFLMGDKFTSADILLTTCLDWAIVYGVGICDNAQPYLERIQARRRYQLAKNGEQSRWRPSFRCNRRPDLTRA